MSQSPAQLYFSGFKLFYFNAILFNKCWFILWTIYTRKTFTQLNSEHSLWRITKKKKQQQQREEKKLKSINFLLQKKKEKKTTLQLNEEVENDWQWHNTDLNLAVEPLNLIFIVQLCLIWPHVFRYVFQEIKKKNHC